MDEAAETSRASTSAADERPSAADLSVTPRDSLLGNTVVAHPAPARSPERVSSAPGGVVTRAARLRLVVNRHIRSGLMGGKRFEVAARVESAQDLNALFKGYADELVLAYKSVFSDKSHSLKRSELVKGCRLTVGSLNEIIELEERLAGAFDQLRRMVEILEAGDRDVVTEA